jgi:DNA-binding response OmpR family regulator
MTRPVALLVDDVPDLLAVMAEVLELALPDHRVLTAASAAEATRVVDGLNARGETLAMVIADQSLGDRTGLELLADLHQAHGARLFLISGAASDEVAAAAHALGAEVLWKPFRMQVLVERVRAST